MKLKDSFDEIFADVKKVMIVMAHPDDLEIYCGGTVLRLLNKGIEVTSIKMTSGNKGCRQEIISEKQLAKIRLNEDKKALDILGVNNNIYLNFDDGEVEDNLSSLEKLVYQIRKFRPDLIITHNPEDIVIKFNKNNSWINHRDHINTGKLVLNASYPYSRDLLFFPEQLKETGINSHLCIKFLLVDYYSHEDTKAFDITDYISKRTQAIAAHSSQYSLPDANDSTNFFTKLDDSRKRFERFRFVVVD